tara:strand:+ start:8844 stop:9779 length:936 start_codon:yes stop_codon:yes gene_type:complete
MNIDDALELWRSDYGSRIINRHNKATKLELRDKIYDVQDVAKSLRSHMKLLKNSEKMTFYRGESTIGTKSKMKNIFTSITTDKEQAESFMDDEDCCLFKVTVDPDVKLLKTGIEDEFLIEDNIYWNVLGRTKDLYIVHVSKQKKNSEKTSLNTPTTKSIFNPILSSPTPFMTQNISPLKNISNTSKNSDNSDNSAKSDKSDKSNKSGKYKTLFQDLVEECEITDEEITKDKVIEYFAYFDEKITEKEALRLIQKHMNKNSKTNSKTNSSISTNSSTPNSTFSSTPTKRTKKMKSKNKKKTNRLTKKKSKSL